MLPPIKRLSKNPTEAEKWTYYSEVYAWRIVRGWGNAEDKTCPIDPKGEWHNELMVAEAVSRYRRIIADERRQHEEAESRHPDVQLQNRRYARAKAWREGKLDQYDAVHHPEKLAERQRQAPAPGSISEVHAELGVSAEEARTEPLGPSIDGRKSFREAVAAALRGATQASDRTEPEPVDLSRGAEAAE